MTPTSPLPVLYSFRRCPYAIRARLAVRAAGLAVALREVVLRDKPAELLALSPAATVPVLQLPDGRVLLHSLDIMRWALAVHDPHGWLRASEADPAQALVDCNDGPFKQSLDRYKYASRHPEKTADAWRDEAVDRWLAPLEDRLSRHRCLLRDTPSLADMALLPFVRQFAGVDPAWFDTTAALPRLREWLQRLVATPLFESVMQRTAPWRPGDAEVVF
ncbi:glutathione S-transferase [Xylophilus sp. Kf1]|nr:glutathione S-transferase [Xylophilus sp. Kf1]